MSNSTTTKPEIGDFINIPAWNVEGMIINQRPATQGSDDAIEVLVEERPHDSNPRWYRLEPSEFSIVA